MSWYWLPSKTLKTNIIKMCWYVFISLSVRKVKSVVGYGIFRILKYYIVEVIQATKTPLRKKCPYLELFWSVSSRIRVEYREIPSIQSECWKMRTRVTPDTFHAVPSARYDLQFQNSFIFNTNMRSDFFLPCYLNQLYIFPEFFVCFIPLQYYTAAVSLQ